jgi:ABC-type branched-subunit amino acid transport system permease subunit
MSRRLFPSDLAARWAQGVFRDRNRTIYTLLIIGALLFPSFADVSTGGSGNHLVSTAADAGVYVLLAIGLNIVVGFAGLLDLGYAAFFAIGAYTYALLASSQLSGSPLHTEFHLPFWVLLLVAMLVAATFGAILGAPTLRLRGDYLAIVTLGFGEIVPRVFRYLGAGSPIGNWTGGVNGISAIDPPKLPAFLSGPWFGISTPLKIVSPFDFSDSNWAPMDYYWLVLILVAICIVIATNLYGSRIGRAWMAVREDEVAAAASGINTVAIKLLAFAIGASFAGFAGCYYGAKLSLVSSENFEFVVSVSILIMVVLGGMGNIPGVILGALTIFFVQFYVLTNLPDYAVAAANAVGLGFLNQSNGGWAGLHDEVQRLNFIVFGLILVSVMLLRPQGLFPSRIREQELEKGTVEEAVFDVRETAE